ncbi:polysaccharide lyase family 7 protein [Collybiopsis luxurians FD-317 M1]|uniref:Polysaccharide lyase family 7 protein n=1 Tax=Collybiopsis luxurians FD-317 M1 TaxID=944289 RepID=A0A0D0C2R7_9AGAR|nr:polysaccharide lyase family 7 protein [Collybiopsis luxurians FD-317 M1]
MAFFSLPRFTAFITLILLLSPTSSIVKAVLDPDCAPGGNFDFTHWELELPIGTSTDPDTPETIKSASLQGCDGFQNLSLFYTESSDVPGSPASSGCVTTANSDHCRTELHEESPSSWDPNATLNRLQVTLAVAVADNSEHGTVIGQIHIVTSVSNKPVCLLYCDQSGNIAIGVEQTLSGDDTVTTQLGNIPLGTMFSYELDYSLNVLQVGINGNFTTLSTFSLDGPASYFKVGNYNLGSTPSEVHFFNITLEHEV